MVWRNMPCLLIACGQRESGWRAGGWGRAGELARGLAVGPSVLDKPAKWTRPRVTYRFVTPGLQLCFCVSVLGLILKVQSQCWIRLLPAPIAPHCCSLFA